MAIEYKLDFEIIVTHKTEFCLFIITFSLYNFLNGIAPYGKAIEDTDRLAVD